MRKPALAAVLAAGLSVAGCTGTDYRAQFERRCTNEWKDSGYRTRLVHSRTGNVLSHTDYFDCQLLVDGKWVPSNSVRISL